MTQERFANLREISQVELLLNLFQVIYDNRQFKIYFYNMNTIAASLGHFEFVTDDIFLQVERHLKYKLPIPQDLMLFYAVAVNELLNNINTKSQD